MANPLTEKRLALAIVLLTLTATAYLTANGTTQIVAASFLDPLEVASPSAAGRPTGAAAAVVTRPTRESLGRSILEQNVFDSQTGSIPWDPPPPPPPAEVDTPAEVVDTTDPDNAPPCEGSIRLVGSYVRRSQPDQSFAAITSAAGTVRLYSVGATVDDRTVFEIRRERVILRPAGGTLCHIALFDAGEHVATPRPAVSPVVMPSPAIAEAVGLSGDGIESAELDANIQQVTETSYVVNRTLVDRLLANQAELMRTARVIPHEVDGRVVGVKIYGIRRSSLLGRLGIQNGDMLRTINGYNLTEPDSVLEAYTRLRTADRLSLTVERRGQSMSLDYQIR